MMRGRPKWSALTVHPDATARAAESLSRSCAARSSPSGARPKRRRTGMPPPFCKRVRSRPSPQAEFRRDFVPSASTPGLWRHASVLFLSLCLCVCSGSLLVRTNRKTLPSFINARQSMRTMRGRHADTAVGDILWRCCYRAAREFDRDPAKRLVLNAPLLHAERAAAAITGGNAKPRPRQTWIRGG